VKKNIIIADDHPIFRLGIRTALETCDDFCLIAEASCASELKECMRENRCDLVLMDIKMKAGEDGMELLGYIRETYPEVKVVIISQYYKKSLIEKAIGLGVNGYITKEDIPDSIIYILKKVFNDEKFFSSKIQEILIGEYSSDGNISVKLTKRETELLELLVSGYGRGDIGEKMGIAVTTVDFHKQNLMVKLNADSLAELMGKAEELNLI
jgi:DNA-binding NarL/FixJ family response regulator